MKPSCSAAGTGSDSGRLGIIAGRWSIVVEVGGGHGICVMLACSALVELGFGSYALSVAVISG